MTSKKKTTTAKRTGKTVRRSAMPATPSVPVQTSVFDCFCTANETTSAIVCARVDGPVSVTHYVVGVVSQATTTVTRTVKTVAAKVVSVARSVWNRVKATLSAGAGLVKAAAIRTKRYVKEKASQAAVYTLLGLLHARAYGVRGWNRVKTFSVSTWNRTRANVIALHNRIRAACASAEAQAIETWCKYKPVAVQVGKIIMVAAVLYVFASAVLISSCLIVATLGVHAYDQARLNLATRPARKRIPAKKQLTSPTLFGAI